MKHYLIAMALLIPVVAFADGSPTIVQKGRRFIPSEVTVRAGERLTFTNDDEFIHQIYADGLFDSDEKPPGQKLVEEFSRNGSFEVHCHIHPKMKLVVHVN